MELFGRKWAVTIGTTLITELDISFSVHRTTKPEPNTCELVIYNLNTLQRAALEQMRDIPSAPVGIPTKIDAGYETATSTIWLGDLRTVESRLDTSGDWVTELTSGDGEKAIQTGRINASFGIGTPLTVALNALAAALKVGPGNLAAFSSLAAASKIGQQGFVLSGSAADQLTAITRSIGVEWSIQNGSLQFALKGEPVPGLVALINPQTGLIGSPTVDQNGVLTATTLMLPGLLPGATAVVKSSRIAGNYKITEANYIGDTSGQPWYIEFSAERI